MVSGCQILGHSGGISIDSRSSNTSRIEGNKLKTNAVELRAALISDTVAENRIGIQFEEEPEAESRATAD